jgi:hypothetical protein
LRYLRYVSGKFYAEALHDVLAAVTFTSQSHTDPGVGLGVTFESGLLVRRFVESQGRNDFLYPLLHDGDDSHWIPEYEQLYRVLTKQPKHPRPPLGRIVHLDAMNTEQSTLPPAPTRRRVENPYPMLAWDRSVPENFVYVRLTPKPPERVLVRSGAAAGDVSGTSGPRQECGQPFQRKELRNLNERDTPPSTSGLTSVPPTYWST